MNSDQFISMLRSGLKFAAGYLVAKGAVDQQNAELIIGGVLALSGLIWAHFHHKDDDPQIPLKLGVWILAPLLAISAAFGPVGCQSTPEQTAYRAIGSTTTTVDAAMSAWGGYVRAGKATVEQRVQVRDAFGKYQSAMQVVEDAAIAAKSAPDGTDVYAVALSSASAASGDLIALIQQFTNPPAKSQPAPSQATP